MGRLIKYELKKQQISRNIILALLIGERSNGKTYACLKYALQKWFDGKGEFAVVRRWQEDIKARRAKELFAALMANGEIEKMSRGK